MLLTKKEEKSDKNFTTHRFSQYQY